MAYIPYAQRNKDKQQTTGYVPVAQRVKAAPKVEQPKPPVNKPNFAPGTENIPWYKRPLNPEGFFGKVYSALRPDTTASRFVAELPQAATRTVADFAKGGMAVGKSGYDLITGKPVGETDEFKFNPESKFGKAFAEALYGTEEVSVPNLPKYGQEFTEAFGIKTDNKFANFGVGAILAGLDFTTGGAGDDAIKAIARSKSPQAIKEILKKIGVIEDLAESAAPKLAKIADQAEVKKAIESMAKTQETSRAVPKNIVRNTELVEEAKKYKNVEEFTYNRRGSDLPLEIPDDAKKALNPQAYKVWEDMVETKDVPVSSLKRGESFQSPKTPGRAVTEPILINKDGLIFDGHNRLNQAIANGDETIPARITPFRGEFESVMAEIYMGAIKKSAEADLPELPKLFNSSEIVLPETTPLRQSQPLPESSSLPVQPQSQSAPQQTTQRMRMPNEPDISLPVDNFVPYDRTIAPQQKVVKAGEKPKALGEDVYQANREASNVSSSKVDQIKSGVADSVKNFGKGLDRVLGSISTRLKNIDPSLKKAIRNFEYKLGKSIQTDRKDIQAILTGLEKIKKLDKADYADLDLALKNGDAAKTKELISKYGLEEEFKQVRSTLDELYKRAKEVGYELGYEKDYFPRTIKDPEGFLEHIGAGDDWSIIDEAIKAKEMELGRYLETPEKANLINTMIRGYQQGKITLSETGAMKGRNIDIVDAGLNQFYDDSINSLVRYVDSTNEAIEARRFFGKATKDDKFANIEDSIGTYTLNLLADGKIKPSQEKELRSILQARFNPKAMHGGWVTYKNLAYIDTMGSFTSAVTQLGDLGFSLYKGGLKETGKALVRSIAGKSKITRADLGVEKIAQEFEDASRSAKAVDRVFKIVGLNKFDAIGKETLINASIGKARKLAENPTDDFISKLDEVFGSETQQVIEDLKAGKTTENVKLLAFNNLLDFQPVALSEMPEQYLKGGNGRIFYMLKTYTIKLFDVYRNEVFQQIKKNPKQGVKNLLYLTASLVAMNATADEIKDLMLGRKTSLKDRTVDNMLKLAGFSKFTIYKAREEGIGSAAAKTILPPFKLIDSLYKDATQADEVSQLQSIDSIPLGGKLYYWWFGKGRTKTENKQKKAEGDGGLPSLPELPKLPKLPSLPAIK